MRAPLRRLGSQGVSRGSDDGEAPADRERLNRGRWRLDPPVLALELAYRAFDDLIYADGFGRLSKDALIFNGLSFA